MTREQWMITQLIITTIRVTNAPYGAQDNEPELVTPSYIETIAQEVGHQTSKMMITDLILILEKAHNHAK